MTSEQYLQDSERIIDAIDLGMQIVAKKQGFIFNEQPEVKKAAKEDLKDVLREYGIRYAIEQFEKFRLHPNADQFRNGLEAMIENLKSQLKPE